jgi:hypothetical protein
MDREDQDWSSREAPRRPVRLTAAAQWGDGTALTVEVSNLSYRGCQLCSKQPFTKGETINLVVPNMGQVRAQIRWVKGDRAGARFITGDSVQDARRARIGV